LTGTPGKLAPRIPLDNQDFIGLSSQQGISYDISPERFRKEVTGYWENYA
jgi:hypothetical protein